jgi:hypothetical protein
VRRYKKGYFVKSFCEQVISCLSSRLRLILSKSSISYAQEKEIKLASLLVYQSIFSSLPWAITYVNFFFDCRSRDLVEWSLDVCPASPEALDPREQQ